MSLMNRTKTSLTKRCLVYICSSSLVFPQFAMAAGYVMPSSAVNSGAYTGGEYSGDISVPDIAANAVPDFRELKAGELTIDSTVAGLLIVDQQSEKALAVWNNFNIGQDAAVEFRQPGSDSIAVNMIDQQTPSAILGSLTSNGSVYLLNPNGVIFGETANVNVRGLVAAAMELNGYDPDSSLTQAEQQSFIQDSILEGIANGEAFLVNARQVVEGSVDELPRIVIKQGAEIRSENAPILMAGPEVINDGYLESHEGQVILAGTRKDLYLAVSDNDPDLRGFLVEVHSGAGAERGAVVNAGEIHSKLGNVTLIASDILQAGKITTSTSVDANGSIRILARDQAVIVDNTTVQPNSAALDAAYFDSTEELPSVGSFALGTEGGTVVFTENSETNGDLQSLNEDAFARLYQALDTATLSEVSAILLSNSIPTVRVEGFLRMLGLDETDIDALKSTDGSGFDRSRLATELDEVFTSDQSIELSLLTKVLASAPESDRIEALSGAGVANTQLDSLVLKATDSLDIRATKIDVVGQSIHMREGARMVARGADVSLSARANTNALKQTPEPNSNASLVLSDSVVVDVSGSTEAILGAERNAVEIFVTSNEVKDNPTTKDSDILRETVYVDVIEGTDVLDWESSLASIEKTIHEHTKDAGSIDLRSTGTMALHDDVSLKADAGFARYSGGKYQVSKVYSGNGFVDIEDAETAVLIGGVLNDSSGNSRYRKAYTQGGEAGNVTLTSNALEISDTVSLSVQGNAGVYQRSLDDSAIHGGRVDIDMNTLATSQRSIGVSASDSVEVRDVALSNHLINNSGAQSFSISTAGDVVIEEGAPIMLGAGGDFSISGNNVSIFSELRLLGGDLTIDALNLTRLDASINTSGTWVNDNFDTEMASEVITMDAGSVEINSILDMSESSEIIADAGLWLDQSKTLFYGSAGDISIGRLDANLSQLQGMNIQGSFSAIDFAKGGTLTLIANSVAISDINGGVSALGDELVLDDGWFNTVRVNNFSLQAKQGGVLVDTSAALDLDNQRFSLAQRYGLAFQASNSNATQLVTLDNINNEPALASSLELASFSLAGSGNANAGRIVVEEGARLGASERSSVQLSADKNIDFNGTVSISGGSMGMTVQSQDMFEKARAGLSGSPVSAQNVTSENYIYLGEHASIDLSASTRTSLLANGRHESESIEAGELSVEARYGAVAMHSDAAVNLSGAVTQETVHAANNSVDVARYESGGTLNVKAQSGLQLSGNIDFGESNLGYGGGGINAEIDSSSVSYTVETPPGQHTLWLTGDNGKALYAATENTPSFWAGIQNRSSIDTTALNESYLADLTINLENTIAENVADNVINRVALSEDLSLLAGESLTLDASILDLMDQQLDIDSAYFALGKQNRLQTGDEDLSVFSSDTGLGGLVVNTQFMDIVGSVALNHDAYVNINAAEGLRLSSVYNTSNALLETTFKANGDIAISTPAMWAASLANASITSTESLRIDGGNGTLPTIYSAGSSLTLNAKDVVVDTLITAPFGQININAENRLELGDRAILSVASDETVLLGSVLAEDFSYYYNPTGASLSSVLTFNSEEDYPFAKNVTLEGADIRVDEGSIVDVSGGGDIVAREFIAGLNGSVDYLADNDYSNKFVIIPSHQYGLAPADLNELGGTGIEAGLKVEIKGSTQIADGEYTVLPISYALLPGAMMVTAGQQFDLVEGGDRFIAQNGLESVSARFTGFDDSVESQWQYLQIESAEKLDKYGRYDVLSMRAYIDDASQGVNPNENGGLALKANNSVIFNGSLASNEALSASAYFDLSSSNDIRIVSDVAENESLQGTLLVDDDLFRDVSAGSILVGGVRQSIQGEWTVDPSSRANSVSFEQAIVNAEEVVVVAGSTISLNDSNIEASTTRQQVVSDNWRLGDDGTVLAVSANEALRLQGTQNDFGSLSIDEGSAVSAEGTVAIAFDGENYLSSNEISIEDASLQVVTDSLTIGSDKTLANLSGELLAQTADLDITTSQGLVFAESVDTSIRNLTVTGASISLLDNVSVNVNSQGKVRLIATGEGEQTEVAGQNSRLNLNAQTLELLGQGTGSVVVAANDLALTTPNQLGFSGDVSLHHIDASNGGLSLGAPVVQSLETGSSLALASSGTLSLTGFDESYEVSSELADFGSNIALSGNTIVLDTIVDARAGKLSLFSNSADVETGVGLALESKARLLLDALDLNHDEEIYSSAYATLSMYSEGDIRVASIDAFDFGESQNGESASVSLFSRGELSLGAAQEDHSYGVGTNLFIQSESLSQGTLESIQTMNAKGASGDLVFYQTGTDDFEFDGDWTINSLEVANLGGDLNFSADVEVTGESETISLLAGDNLNVTQSSFQTAVGSLLRLGSSTGSVQVDSSVSADSIDKLEVYLGANNEALDATLIALDGFSESELVLDMYLSNAVDAQTMNQQNLRETVDSLISETVELSNALTSLADDSVSGGGDTAISLNVRPSLDIYSDQSFVLDGGDSSIIDLSKLRNAEGKAGKFSLRSSESLVLNNSLSDGIKKIGVVVSNGQLAAVVADNLNDDIAGHIPVFEQNLVLTGSESSSIQLSSGSSRNSVFGASDLFSKHDLVLGDNTYVRTGTGDIDINASGSIVLADNAHISSVGRTYVDSNGVPVLGIYRDEAGNVYAQAPSDITTEFVELMPFVSQTGPSLKLLNEQFSGLSFDSGNITLSAGGNVLGASSQSEWNNYYNNLVIDQYAVPGFPPATYSDIGLGFASIDRMSSGVHNLGGGATSITAGSDISSLSVSSPGSYFALGNEDAAAEFAGGDILLSSGNDINGLSLQSDDGVVNVWSGGSITADSSGRSLRLAGSDTEFNIHAGHGVVLDGIVNSSVSLFNFSKFTNLQAPTSYTNNALARYYFDGWDNSQLNLASLSGDVILANDYEVLGSYYDTSLASQFSDLEYENYLLSNKILPSKASMTSLLGDVVLEGFVGESSVYALSLFPSARASFEVVAGQDISSKGRVLVSIPDFAASVAPSIDEALDKDQLISLMTNDGVFRPYSREEDARLNHSSNLVDRDAQSLKLLSLNGNIGDSSNLLRISAPTAADIYAGGDIINLGLSVQHQTSSDITTIVAGGDFRYPFLYDLNGAFEPSSGEQTALGVNVAGPGELILQAGGNIDLGTSKGIRSIANTQNLNLESEGAGLHIYAGIDQFGDLSALIGGDTAIAFANDHQSFVSLSLAALDTQYQRYDVDAQSSDETILVNAFAERVSAANGEDYTTLGGLDFSQLRSDYDALPLSLKNKIAVDWLAEVSLQSPEYFVSNADLLYNIPEKGGRVLDDAERSQVFAETFALSSQLVALSALLENSSADGLLQFTGADSLTEFAELPASAQVSAAIAAFSSSDNAERTLLAEAVLNAQIQQSGVEGVDAGVALAKFERGVVAQRLFFGQNYDYALKWMLVKNDIYALKESEARIYSTLEDAANAYRLGKTDGSELLALSKQYLGDTLTQGDDTRLDQVFGLQDLSQLASVINGVSGLDEVKLGGPGAQTLASVQAVYDHWQNDSGVDFGFDSAAVSKGNIGMLFTTIQTLGGGDVNLYAPSASIDVGQSAQQIASVYGGAGVPPAEDELGVLSFGKGNINAVVADAFNVNESRTIPLLGGDVNIWSAFGDIDAGRGSKTALASPETLFQISTQTGLINSRKAAAVSGSGISTREAPANFETFSSASERYRVVSVGAGQAVLTTPFGVVDAGEAGIQSAGNLFLAAQKVGGADNISVGGVSAGVPVSSSLSTDLGGVGSAVDAATEAVQASAEKAVADAANQTAAFVTIELL